MKKTKLLTSIAALALVLSLGACTEPTEETTSEESGEVTTETDTTYEEEVSTEGAYAIVGDFVDADWDNEPATDSKYFIPAETEEFKVTVTTASEPVDNEWWTDTNQWDAGLSVVEYGTWDRVAGYTELDEASTGVKGSSASNDVSLAWNTTYDVTVTFGETNSILVKEHNASVADMLADIKESNNFCLTIEYYDWYSGYYEDADQLNADYKSGDLTRYGHDYYVDLTYTEDAIMMKYYYSYANWYYGLYDDIELYVNDYENNQVLCYWVNYPDDEYADVDYTDLYVGDVYEGGTWQELMWSPLDLVDSASRFVKGDTTSGNYGDETAYTISNLDIDFLNLLCDALFNCGNWFCEYYSYFVYYAAFYYSYYGITPTISGTFYADYGEFDLNAYDFVQFSYNDSTSSTGKLYWLEFDSVYTYLSDVGTSAIPDAYAAYLS